MDDAREHLINIALDGFSPVSSLKQDEGAQMASEENVAGIIPGEAQAPGLWPDVFHETEKKYVLVASTHYVRLLICEVRFVQSACHVVGRQGLRMFVAL
eukprot:s8917_g1.t1